MAEKELESSKINIECGREYKNMGPIEGYEDYFNLLKGLVEKRKEIEDSHG